MELHLNKASEVLLRSLGKFLGFYPDLYGFNSQLKNAVQQMVNSQTQYEILICLIQ
jgi:hypothetical protein